MAQGNTRGHDELIYTYYIIITLDLPYSGDLTIMRELINLFTMSYYFARIFYSQIVIITLDLI